jgi:hypothetical protein
MEATVRYSRFSHQRARSSFEATRSGAGIPEFQSIGLQVGQNIAAALTGKMTVDQTFQASQTEVERAVRQGGYLK